jgi:hypothetical protein
VLNLFHSTKGWTKEPDKPCDWRVVRSPQLSFWVVDFKLKGMDCPTRKSSCCKVILDFVKKHVCPLADSFAVCLATDLSY